jgi:excisionase family DNA binding protein
VSLDAAIRAALLEVLRSTEGQDAIRRALGSTSPAANVTQIRPATDYLSVSECARIGGKTEDTIRRHIADGTLPATKPAGSREWAIRPHDFDRWMGGSKPGASVVDLDALARKKAGG